jgi:hypothetical protein
LRPPTTVEEQIKGVQRRSLIEEVSIGWGLENRE